MIKRNLYLVLCVMMGALYSCKKDVAPPVDVGYDYFPTNVGHWIIYDVVSIVHDAPVNKHDT